MLLRSLWLALFATAVAACSAGYPNRPTSDFRLRDIAKTDIDRVAEIHLQETLLHLKTVMEKLYRRNPQEWKKNGGKTMEAVVSRVFAERNFTLPGLEGRYGVEAIADAFKEDYAGDRVAAYIVGLTTMILSAYGDRTEFLRSTTSIRRSFTTALAMSKSPFGSFQTRAARITSFIS